MDLRLPRLDGVGATARIVAEHPGSRVLILTTYDADADIVRAVEAGATGYLLKDTPRQQLVEAVRAAAHGETVLARGRGSAGLTDADTDYAAADPAR
jgi:DNA-binding NarL/FixJ family response regulator